MRVYILGAGASRGSQEHPGGQPEQDRGPRSSRVAPLVNELFLPIYEHHGQLIGLTPGRIQEVRDGVGNHGGSVEEWLTAEWDNTRSLREESTKQHKRALFGRVAFYLWSLFLELNQGYEDRNGYRLFVQKVLRRDESFGIVNFNYDLLSTLPFRTPAIG